MPTRQNHTTTSSSLQAQAVTFLDILKQPQGHNCLGLTLEEQLKLHWLILADQIEMGISSICHYQRAWMPAIKLKKDAHSHPIEGWNYRLKQ